MWSSYFPECIGTSSFLEMEDTWGVLQVPFGTFLAKLSWKSTFRVVKFGANSSPKAIQLLVVLSIALSFAASWRGRLLSLIV